MDWLAKLTRLAIIVGIGLTLLGAMAPVFPWLDAINHFRPVLFAGSVLLVFLSWQLSGPRRWRFATGLALANAALFALPLAWSAGTLRGQAQAGASQREMMVLTFNMAWSARPVDNVADFILSRRPDIALLQEVSLQHAEALKSRLAGAYPHIRHCTVFQGCSQLLLSRHPWLEAKEVYRSTGEPEMIWARFDHPRLGKLKVHGLHLAWPFTPDKQVRHIDQLLQRAGTLAEPAIFAGDFNLTPWSYQMQRLQAVSGLRRHATFLRSWPTDGQLRIPLPLVLIDHVLSTPDIRTVSIEIGPNLGSDHLPVIATLSLPKAQLQ